MFLSSSLLIPTIPFLLLLQFHILLFFFLCLFTFSYVPFRQFSFNFLALMFQCLVYSTQWHDDDGILNTVNEIQWWNEKSTHHHLHVPMSVLFGAPSFALHTKNPFILNKMKIIAELSSNHRTQPNFHSFRYNSYGSLQLSVTSHTPS